jgi:prepilin-type N-terminal cleavage/methylation domain-containing protein
MDRQLDRQLNKQSGNSLLEILLVLAVSGVLVTLALRYFTVVDLNMRVARAISQIDMVSRASYEWLEYQRAANFAEISTQSLLDAHLIAEEDLKSPWGGEIQVLAGDDLSHVKIKLSGISAYGCQDLTRHLQSVAYSEALSQSCKKGEYFGEF